MNEEPVDADEKSDVHERAATDIRLGTVVLDTPDPAGLARFYADLLGWTLDPNRSSDDWVTIRRPGQADLAFQLTSDLVRPTWPTGGIPQQAHLDLYVASYDGPEARALELGATLLEGSDDHADFRVYADPSGHPFCLCLEG